MDYLLFEKIDRVGILTINRPKALNALNMQILLEMHQFLSQDILKEGIQVLIVTGAGEKAFIAGADIKAMNAMNSVQMYDFLTLGQKVTLLLERADFVTIAAVNGFALGGGLEMALACDFIYASAKAKLGLPEVTLGLIPGFGGTQRLARAVGTRKAKEMVFTGNFIRAGEAKALNLVNEVVEPEQLKDVCLEVAGKICGNSFFAVLEAKRSINLGYNISLPEALEMEKQMCTVSFTTDDRVEGMDAFINKRKPDFKS